MAKEIGYIDITPTKEGLLRIRAVLQEQVQKSESIVKRAQRLYDALQAGDRIDHRDYPFIMEALQVYEDQETTRIFSIQQGLEAPDNESESESNS